MKRVITSGLTFRNGWYFGKDEFEKYGQLVSDNLSEHTISKRADWPDDKPGGLVYEAKQLGIDDFYDLLGCLEGMCHNRMAREIDDSTYLVL